MNSGPLSDDQFKLNELSQRLNALIKDAERHQMNLAANLKAQESIRQEIMVRKTKIIRERMKEQLVL